MSDETTRETNALTEAIAPEIERTVATPGRFAIKVRQGTPPEVLKTMMDALPHGDFIYEDGGPILEVTATGVIQEKVEHDDKPSTPYGVRVFYDDGTMEEIFDIVGVQVADLTSGTFPFGFMETEGDDGEPEHRAGHWDEDGQFVPFEVAKPRIGW